MHTYIHTYSLSPIIFNLKLYKASSSGHNLSQQVLEYKLNTQDMWFTPLSIYIYILRTRENYRTNDIQFQATINICQKVYSIWGVGNQNNSSFLLLYSAVEIVCSDLVISLVGAPFNLFSCIVIPAEKCSLICS
ncbi:hypothetical protein PanWU01x14_234090 [Parasponia andersonii]|uniref:Uncharacterized protein n=1 Tax=Parasponia andersonii TaxID=3476 RepID=A0A2P5BJD8_PARAD|nr:hypothetical protein PanWU01x14_234090 [Parasponia andersonii]